MKIKITHFLCPFVILSLFSACETTKNLSLVVPWEREARQKNVYAEYFTIAENYRELKNYSKAIDYYSICLESEDFYDSSYYNLGVCYALSNDWEKSRTIFENILKKDSENLTLQKSLAYITAMEGDFDSALLQYKTLVEKQPFDSDLLKNYIALLLADEKYELAEQQFFVLKERFPDDSSISSIQTKIADGLGL